MGIFQAEQSLSPHSGGGGCGGGGGFKRVKCYLGIFLQVSFLPFDFVSRFLFLFLIFLIFLNLIFEIFTFFILFL